MNYPRSLLRVYIALVGIIFIPLKSFGQSTTIGIIEGRVQNVVKGDYLDKARVMIEGTNIETLTDAIGQYRFSNVPTGEVRVRATFTGLEPQVRTVTVQTGQTTHQDFELMTTAAAAEREANSTVLLDKFVVNATKDTNDAAIAINEQRFAPNMKTVVSTDEFGNNAEGNLGEFLKFVPGLTVEYTGGEPRQIQLNGAFGQYTNILMNGMGMASAASSGTARTIELEQISINNVSRIEYVRSPTPESPGNSLSGYINMVPRSAFERSRASGTYQIFLEMPESSFLSFTPIPGPQNHATRKVNPGATFNYINPINSKIGFTLSGSTSGKDLVGTGFTYERFGTSNFGTPPAGSPYTNANPYPQQYVISNNPIFIQRSSWAATIDFKLGQNDVFSLGTTWARYSGEYGGRDLVINAGSGNVLATGPLEAGVNFVHGRPGQGSIAINTGGSGAQHKYGTTFMPTLTWRHNGPIWTMEGGAGYSHATNHYRDVSDGYAATVVLSRTNVTVNFDDVGPQAPGKITVLDNAPGHVGEVVDFRKLSNYNVLRQGSGERDSYDLKRTLFGKLSRHFDLPWTTLSTKVGFDVQQQVRNTNFNLVTWVPVAGTSSANGGYMVDASFLAQSLPYAGGTMEWASQWKSFQDLKNNPQNWVLSGATAANPTAGEGAKLRDVRNR
ncbi:MAG: carboxypeptidase regulatory-like domain-containing protein, partial [Opitutus sp.]